MIRWQYLTVRILVLLAVLAILRWTAGPLAHFLAVRSLERSTGAKVDIATTELGLFPPRLHLTGVVIADPRKAMRNAFEASDIFLALDGSALLKRRYEVANGRIRGIRIGGERTESGLLEVVPEDPAAERGPSIIGQWCQTLAGDAQQQAEEFGESLATVIEAKRIRQHWEAEYADLRARAKRLEDEVRALKTTARSIDNPLRDLPALQESLRRADEIRTQMKIVRQRLDSLPSQFQSDLRAIDRARQSDQQRVAAYFPEGFSGSPQELGPELLGAMVREQLQQVRAYVDSGRRIAQVTVTSPKLERARGETVTLDAEPRPDWLVRRCEVEGFFSVDSQQYTMLGVVENVAGGDVRIDQPLHARLRLDGPRVVRIDYKRHHDSAVPRDQLRIHWPELDLPAMRVAKGARAHDPALVLDGGKLELWVEVQTEGERIQGRLVSKQTQTRVGLQTTPELERTVVVQSLKSSLSAIDQVDVDATFAGNWKQLDLDIHTNLTACISDSLRGAVAAQVADTRQRLAAKVDRAYEKHTVELQQWLSQQQSGARDLLAQTDAAIDSMSKKVVRELGTPEAYLGKLRSGINRAIK